MPYQLPRPGGTPLLLQLAPLSLGFQRRLRAHGIVPPAPPTRVARDAQGKPIRDDRGLAVLVTDRHDPDYLDKLELHHARVAVLAVAEALRDDPANKFRTPPPPGDAGWNDYADALHDELEAAGWTAGDLVRVCDEICRLSNLLDDHLDSARRNFSPSPTGDTT